MARKHTDAQLRLFVEEEIKDSGKDVEWLTWFEAYDLDDDDATRAEELLRQARIDISWPD